MHDNQTDVTDEAVSNEVPTQPTQHPRIIFPHVRKKPETNVKDKDKPRIEKNEDERYRSMSTAEKITFLRAKIARAKANINNLQQDIAIRRNAEQILEWERQLSMLQDFDDTDEDMDPFDLITLNAKQVAAKRSNALVITGNPGVGKTMTVIQAIAYLNPHRTTEQVVKIIEQLEKTKDEEKEVKPEPTEIKVDTPVASEKPKFSIPLAPAGKLGNFKRAAPMKKHQQVKVVKPSAQSMNNIESGYFIAKGTCTCAALYELLFLHRKKLLVFDDFDSILKDPECINLLKAALDTYPIREISKMTKGNTFNSFGMSDAEMQERYELDGKLPNQFRYQGNIIFISNLHEKDFDKALMSRALHVEVNLTKAQIIERLRFLLNDVRPEIQMDWKLDALNYLEFLTTNFKHKFDLELRQLIHAIDYRAQYPHEDEANIIELKSGKKVKAWQQLLKKRIVETIINNN